MGKYQVLKEPHQATATTAGTAITSVTCQISLICLRLPTDLTGKIAAVVGMIGDLAKQQAGTEQRPDLLRQQQQATDQRFNNLLEDARADRQQAERDRALTESEHRVFRETFQTQPASRSGSYLAAASKLALKGCDRVPCLNVPLLSWTGLFFCGLGELEGLI